MCWSTVTCELIAVEGKPNGCGGLIFHVSEPTISRLPYLIDFLAWHGVLVLSSGQIAKGEHMLYPG